MRGRWRLQSDGSSRVIVLSLAAIVAACATAYWTKPGFNAADWNRDRYECERDMRQSGYYGAGLVGEINASAFFERCLVAKGYFKTTASQTYTPPPSKVSEAELAQKFADCERHCEEIRARVDPASCRDTCRIIRDSQ
jgi:hypothetical protein